MPFDIHHYATWLIAAITVACVLIRPRNLPEAAYAVAGAALLVLSGLQSWRSAGAAIGKGMDVYLFLSGMMLLSEIARREGVFDWCAQHAARRARGSPVRLFWLMYGTGILITIFLSNDATAVVMTPAVLAATRAARVRQPMPYLLACAFVANAASFVLPISNPANIVLFNSHLPPLAEWLRLFFLPSLVSIGLTGAVLFIISRKDLSGHVETTALPAPLSPSGKLALGGIAFAAVALVTASALRFDLGAPTLVVALMALGLVALRDRRVFWEAPKHVSWSVLPLVAGLFVIVEAVNQSGVLAWGQAGLTHLAALLPWQRDLAGAFSITALSNVINNLPSGLITGGIVSQWPPPAGLRSALLIGVDLGPNVSVSGSLATILWLIALRREQLHVSAWSFLKAGLIVTPPALAAAVLVSTLLAK